MKTYFFLLLNLLTYFTLKAQQTPLANKTMGIRINTANSELSINQQKIDRPFDLAQLTKLLGKPDRIETEIRKTRYEKYGTKRTPANSTMVKVTYLYHFFDKHGLMLITSKSRFKSKAPVLFICYQNVRKYSNTHPLKFAPKNSFAGELIINNHQISPRANLIPENVTYRTKEFDLWGLTFGPTSIGGNIDRLYSIKSKIYLMIYLDSPANLEMSYIEIR